MSPIRIFLVDDHVVLRQAVAGMLTGEPDIEVVGEAGDGEEALAKIRDSKPDAILLDIKMPDVSGLAIFGDIQKLVPKAKIVIFTMYENPAYVNAAIRAGAAGYVMKSVSREELLEAIRAVHAGKRFLHPDVARPLLRRVALEAKLKPDRAGLTVRDLQVLELLAEGHSNKLIAHALHISDESVKSHLKRLFDKLGVSDRTAAVALALRQNIIE